MRSKTRYVVVTASIMVVALVLMWVSISLADGEEPCGAISQSVEGPPFDQENVCAEYPEQDGPVTNPAMQNPDQFAWEKFAELNKTAGINEVGEEVVLWRTWPEQADVYVAEPDPNNPPQWADISGLENQLAGHASIQQAAKNSGITLSTAPSTTDPIDSLCEEYSNNSEEVRLNQEHVEYVVANDLWYVEGKQQAFADSLTVNFPTNAIEVKANWITATLVDDPTAHYLVQDSEGLEWALIAMHFMTKDIPNWVWATFEHKDNPCYNRYLKAQDSFGLDPNGEPSEALLEVLEEYGLNLDIWSNYRMDGTQVTFTDDVGRPIILGNSVTEFGFQTTASCMTCHARATTDATGSGHLSVFNSHQQSDHGVPDPEWYFSSFNPPTQSYLPLDFSWAVAICPNPIGGNPNGQANCPLPGVDQ